MKTRAFLLTAPLALLFAGALTASAVEAGAPALDAPAGIAAKNPEQAKVASLRRTLASVIVLKRVNLSADQKRELRSILTDAKALREKARDQASANAPFAQREKTLEKAIDEARATGRVSDDTKASMKSMAEKVKTGASALKDERRALVERLKALLTPEQMQALKGLRDDLPAPARARVANGAQGRGRGGKALLLRLMMSDEFAAELAK